MGFLDTEWSQCPLPRCELFFCHLSMAPMYQYPASYKSMSKQADSQSYHIVRYSMSYSLWVRGLAGGNSWRMITTRAELNTMHLFVHVTFCCIIVLTQENMGETPGFWLEDCIRAERDLSPCPLAVSYRYVQYVEVVWSSQSILNKYVENEAVIYFCVRESITYILHQSEVTFCVLRLAAGKHLQASVNKLKNNIVSITVNVCNVAYILML